MRKRVIAPIALFLPRPMNKFFFVFVGAYVTGGVATTDEFAYMFVTAVDENHHAQIIIYGP